MTQDSRDQPTVDFDAPEPEEQRLAARRMQQYSKEALRIGLIVDRTFIKHDRFSQALTAFDRLFQVAPEFDMPHGFRLIGPPGSGKSALFRYFRDGLPRSSLFAPGFGAVGVRTGKRPTAGKLVAALLRAYRYPFKSGGASTVYGRRGIVFDMVREKGTRVVLIDEAHHLLKQARRADQPDDEPEATDFLRELVDEAHVGLVLSGTDVLDRLHSVDAHLDDRVPGRYALCHFPFDRNWRGLLRGFRKQCTEFDLALLEDEQEARRLNVACSGSLRRLKRLLTEAVLIAVTAGQGRLTVEILGRAQAAVQGLDGMEINPYAA